MIPRMVLVFFIVACCFQKAPAQDTVRITDYGYIPGSRGNAVPFVIKALEDCRKKQNPVLVFAAGRYDFWPQYCPEKQFYESNTNVIPLRRCPVLIEGFNKIEINGQGSDFIFHDRMQPFTIDSSRQVTIRNVHIDWDIPLSAQAEIIAVSDESIDLAIDGCEFPYIIENGKLVFTGEGWKSAFWGVMEFDKTTRMVAPQTGDNGCLGAGAMNYKAVEIKPGLVRLQYPFKRKPAAGNFLVLRHSSRDHAGTFIINSRDVLIENLDMYHNAGLGILSQYSENITFRNVHVVPNKAKKRVLSGHDDGLHFSNCRGQLTVDSCKFLALMDDPVNVHGTSVRIIEKKDNKNLICKFVHPMSIGFVWARENESVAFIENAAMSTIDSGRVASFTLLDPEQFAITFKDPVPEQIGEGDALENLTWTPDIIIKNSFFGSNRARGILISTPGKVVIENNVFESSGSAILIAGDANEWYESGAVRDVTIRNNTFNDACLTSMYQFCEGIISIYPEIPRLDAAKPFHRNIRIEHNTFHPYDYPVLYAKSTAGLYFNNNRIIRSGRFQPFHERKFMITLEACSKTEIRANILEGDVLGKNIKLLSTSKNAVTLDKKQGIVFAQ